MLFWPNDIPKVENFQEAPLTETEDIRQPTGGRACFFTTSDKVNIRIAIL